MPVAAPSVYSHFQTGTQNTIAALPVPAGSSLVVCVFSNSGAARSVSSLKHGAVSLTQRGSAITNGTIRMHVASLYFAGAATADLVCIYNLTCASAMVAFVQAGMLPDSDLQVDRLPRTTGYSTTPNPGTTLPLNAWPEQGFIFLGSAEFSDGGLGSTPPGTWDAGVVPDALVGSPDLTKPVRLAAGHYTSLTPDAYALGKTGLEFAIEWCAFTLTMKQANNTTTVGAGLGIIAVEGAARVARSPRSVPLIAASKLVAARKARAIRSSALVSVMALAGNRAARAIRAAAASIVALLTASGIARVGRSVSLAIASTLTASRISRSSRMSPLAFLNALAASRVARSPRTSPTAIIAMATASRIGANVRTIALAITSTHAATRLARAIRSSQIVVSVAVTSARIARAARSAQVIASVGLVAAFVFVAGGGTPAAAVPGGHALSEFFVQEVRSRFGILWGRRGR